MSYWTDRQRQLNTALEKDEEKLKARLSRLYDTEAARLDKEIAAYFAKYGEDNVLEYRKLLEELPDEDKVLLIERMNEFAAKYPEYSHLMPVRESVYKLDRLQGLQASVQMQQLELAGKEQEMISEHLEKAGQRAFKTAAETMGFGSSFYAMNKDITKTFVDVPWSNGMKFSDSIWSNKQKLYGYLNRDLAQGLARGDSYERITKHMTNRFKNVSKRDAYRLIYTEGTFVQAEASIQPFTEDFDKYRVSTVGDAKVCDICEGISEEVFDIKDRKPGENFPPFHPWCRCTFIIEIEDRSAWVDQYVAKHGAGTQEQAENIADKLVLRKPDQQSSEAFERIITECKADKAEYLKVEDLKDALSVEEIIDRVGGGDKTVGSCVSLCHAYIGNRAGWNVLDFKGGGSQIAFAAKQTTLNLCRLDGVSSMIAQEANDFAAAAKLIKAVEAEKEYLFLIGDHAAIIRKAEKGYEYLELQTEGDNGFKPLTQTALKNRFGCKKSHYAQGFKLKNKSILIDIETLYNNSEYKKILGYINTAEGNQVKGIGGYAK